MIYSQLRLTPPLPQHYHALTPWLRRQPERYVNKKDKIDELRIPPPHTYILRALGAGPQGLKTTLLKMGLEPDNLTNTNINNIKQIISNTSYEIYKRIKHREATQKYGAPD